MIYTITLNPCIDYVVDVDNLKKGMTNRSAGEYLYPGGKGINVSIMLSHFGKDTTALGYISGFTGSYIEASLKNLGINTDFINIKNGFSRINIKLRELGSETELNGAGPGITKEHIASLYERIDIIEDGDIIVLCGSVNESVPSDIYERICEKVIHKDIKIVVDSSGALLRNVLKYKPFLVKPNIHELGDLFDTNLKTEKEILLYAERLKEEGAENVIVSMGADGAILIDENNKIHKSDAPRIHPVNSVGAGDSMVAGFVSGYLEAAGNYEKAFKLALAAGSATAAEEWLASREAAVKLYKTL